MKITGLIISETNLAMPIKFAVKIVRLKIHITIAREITLTFIQGHKCASNFSFFTLQYLGHYLSYYIQIWHDARHGCPIFSCSFRWPLPWCKVTVGRQRQKNQRCIFSATKQAISIKMTTTVGHFLRDLDLDFTNVFYGLSSLLMFSFGLTV